VITLVTVGTGTVAPSARRGSPAHWVETDGVRLLMDCGAGICHRLELMRLPWFTITHIGLTHFHPDHFGELPALLFAMKYGAREPRRAPLTLLGPAGLRERLTRLAAAFGDWVTEPGWPLSVVELTPGAPVELGAAVTLDTFHTPHTDESLAFAVTTPAGRLVYTGDTGPSDPLADWARGCDLLLAECSLPDADAIPIHLSPTSAGALAERAQAKRLVLTHLYPPAEEVDAAGVAGSAFGGPVQVAQDGSRFTIG